MYYLIQEKRDKKEVINEVIKDLPYYVNLFDGGIQFFNQYDIKVEELLDAYNFIEFLLFDNIVKDLKEKYKDNIDNKLKEDIIKKFDKSEFSIIKKNNLRSACRKVISRFLKNVDEDNDGNENNLLELYLYKEDLWDKEIWKNNELLKRDLNKLKELKITIGQCYDLYKCLKEEDIDIELKGIVLSKDDDDSKIFSSELTIIKKKNKRPKGY
jgi:hypothetical protein